jgi:hypothetical protein
MSNEINHRGGSFLPQGDDFFQTPAPRTGAKRPPKEREEAVEYVEEDEEPSANLTRVTPQVTTPEDAKLAEGLNGVPDMTGGLPSIFLKEAEMLGLEITDEDVMAYVYKGSVTKEIPVIKNILSVKMRTLTSKEISDINLRMSEKVKERPDMIQKEYLNQNTMFMFAYAVEGLGTPGKVKAFPQGFEKRHSQLCDLAPQVISKLTHRYNLLEFLIQNKLSDEAFVKNF